MGKVRNIGIKSTKQKGFTILEIVIVLGIIGVIMGGVVTKVMQRKETGNYKLAEIGVGTIVGAISEFRSDTRRMPKSLDELKNRPSDVKKWFGPYTTDIEDPWGNDYQYRNPGQHGKFDVFSFGSDGKSGGKDLDADINSWEL